LYYFEPDLRPQSTGYIAEIWVTLHPNRMLNSTRAENRERSRKKAASADRRISEPNSRQSAVCDGVNVAGNLFCESVWSRELTETVSLSG
jgi:hypothetical protein